MEVTCQDRTLTFTKFPLPPGRFLEGLDTFEVRVGYKGESNVGTGVMLDSHIIPLMLQGLEIFTGNSLTDTNEFGVNTDEFVKSSAKLLADAWEFRGGRPLRESERQSLQDVIEQWFCDEAM